MFSMDGAHYLCACLSFFNHAMATLDLLMQCIDSQNQGWWYDPVKSENQMSLQHHSDLIWGIQGFFWGGFILTRVVPYRASCAADVKINQKK